MQNQTGPTFIPDPPPSSTTLPPQPHSHGEIARCECATGEVPAGARRCSPSRRHPRRRLPLGLVLLNQLDGQARLLHPRHDPGRGDAAEEGEAFDFTFRARFAEFRSDLTTFPFIPFVYRKASYFPSTRVGD